MALKTPKELFEDEIDYNPDFVPTDYEQKNNLFWHVPAFLEDNSKNERLTQITATEENKENGEEGNAFRRARLKAVTDYTNDVVFPAFDEKVEFLWLEQEKRYDVIAKAEQLIVRSQYNFGYGQSGLYLDYTKLLNLLSDDVPISQAEKIIDNNLFLGNMATYYVSLVNDGKVQGLCDTAKKNYERTLKLMQNERTHFVCPEEKDYSFKYVEDENQNVVMKFFDEDSDEPDLLNASGPQFLCDVKLYKQKEIEYSKEVGNKDNEVKANMELRNFDEQLKILQKHSNDVLDKEEARVNKNSIQF